MIRVTPRQRLNAILKDVICKLEARLPKCCHLKKRQAETIKQRQSGTAENRQLGSPFMAWDAARQRLTGSFRYPELTLRQ
jgi:hypothetical protein